MASQIQILGEMRVRKGYIPDSALQEIKTTRQSRRFVDCKGNAGGSNALKDPTRVHWSLLADLPLQHLGQADTFTPAGKFGNDASRKGTSCSTRL
jgi:hypothetical protein